LLKIPLLKINGAEPSVEVANEFKKFDACIFLTEKSLSHTKARRDASKKGVRLASMPGITKSVLKRSIDIDYDRLKVDSKRLASQLNKGTKVRITTKLGTDITFSINKRKAHGLSAGIYDTKGKWGNLPEGEIFIAPVEGTASGHFVVDGSIAGFGKTIHPLIFIVKKGHAVKIMNGEKPPKVEELLDKVGKGARNIAEFGIGLNRKAKVTGIVLEDEKAYGTCHIALGNNIGFGGRIDVPLHIDCVIKKPTIYLNTRMIMKKGKLLL
jgi:leucyl aminopeptidase (aminopeptidase T)